MTRPIEWLFSLDLGECLFLGVCAEAFALLVAVPLFLLLLKRVDSL